MIRTVDSNEFELTGGEPASDEALDCLWLPDLAERQETLRRANEALERARVLLQAVNRLERGKLRRAPDPEPSSKSRNEMGT